MSAEAAAVHGHVTADLTIDDLAAAAGLPSRTIRFYQSQGLLPKPELRGRVAIYGSLHLERLRLVAELQDRGLQIKAIAALLKRVDKGEVRLQDWLGLSAELDEPAAKDVPLLLSRRELGELCGEAGELPPGRLARLLRATLIERRGDTFLVESPATLALAMKLEAAGVDLDDVMRATQRLRKRLAKVADELAGILLPKKPKRDVPLASFVKDLRPSAEEAARLVFAQELDRVLRAWVNSGKAVKA